MKTEVMMMLILIAIVSVLAGTAAAVVIAVVSEFLAGMVFMLALFIAALILEPIGDELIVKMFGEKQD